LCCTRRRTRRPWRAGGTPSTRLTRCATASGGYRPTSTAERPPTACSAAAASSPQTAGSSHPRRGTARSSRHPNCLS
jgi:hypothetical protein